MSEKLQKVLARLGLGSRRELDALIAAGRVEVNGQVASIGERVEGDITVKIDGKVVATPLTSKPLCRVLMYYKPEGELTTFKDPEDRPTVFDHIPKPDSGRWIYVGRLDLNTSGLLLFTTDGELANALMHPRNCVERVYASRIYGEVTPEQISALTTGVNLPDGLAKFDKVIYQGGEGRNQWYHVSLKEGRNREVRRLWEAVGCQVSRLIRIKYAGLSLDETLKTGQFRELTLSEINNIRAVAGLKPLDSSQIARTPLIDPKANRHKGGPKKGSMAARPKGARGAKDNAFSKRVSNGRIPYADRRDFDLLSDEALDRRNNGNRRGMSSFNKGNDRSFNSRYDEGFKVKRSSFERSYGNRDSRSDRDRSSRSYTFKSSFDTIRRQGSESYSKRGATGRFDGRDRDGFDNRDLRQSRNGSRVLKVLGKRSPTLYGKKR